MTKVNGGRAEIAQTEQDIETLSTRLKENHLALTALSERGDVRLAPGIDKIESTLAPMMGIPAKQATAQSGCARCRHP